MDQPELPNQDLPQAELSQAESGQEDKPKYELAKKERPFYISLVVWMIFFIIMAVVLAWVKGDINV